MTNYLISYDENCQTMCVLCIHVDGIKALNLVGGDGHVSLRR